MKELRYLKYILVRKDGWIIATDPALPKSSGGYVTTYLQNYVNDKAMVFNERMDAEEAMYSLYPAIRAKVQVRELEMVIK